MESSENLWFSDDIRGVKKLINSLKFTENKLVEHPT